MTRIDYLLDKFKEMFPVYGKLIEKYRLRGRNSIIVALRNNAEFIFSYHNADEWKLETSKHYVKEAKGDYKM